jgi:hypothetical protein
MGDSASGVADKGSARERHEQFSERHGGHVVSGKEKRAIKQAARRACHRLEEETSDSACGLAGVLLAGERNERFSEWRSVPVVCGRKKWAIQRAARWACCRQQKEMGDSASGTAGVSSAGETNARFSKRRGGRVVSGRKKWAIQQAARWTSRREENETSVSASGTAGKSSARERKGDSASGTAGNLSP